MKVGDLVKLIGLKVGPDQLYNHPEMGIVTEVLYRDGVVDVLFGMIHRRINSKYVEAINESR